MQIRLARGADAPAVETIRIEAWRVAYRDLLPQDELDAMPIDANRWRARFDVPPDGWATFVAERDSTVIGFAAVGPSRDEQGLGELYAIYVDPKAWSSGAGRALIVQAEEQLARAYPAATLWVLTGNARARHFYERAGWQPDGSVKAEEIFGVAAEELRYSKQLREPTGAAADPARA
jgi:ribosomal protein S18 acetylase RimI-like enzyme